MTDSLGRVQGSRVQLDPETQKGALPEIGAIFRQHLAYVVQTLRRLGVRESDVEDVAHEVFLVVLRRLSTYDRARALRPWIFGIALRVASDYRKHVRVLREEPADALERRPADGPTPDDRLATEHARRQVLRALDELDLDRRAVFILHELDELPIPAVAEALGIPLNTAYSRLRSGRVDFKRALSRQKGATS